MNVNGNSYEDFMQRAKEVEEYDNLDCRIIAADCIRQLADELDNLVPQLVKANGLIENLRIKISELEKCLIVEQEHNLILEKENQHYKDFHDKEIKRQADWEKASKERSDYGIY
jgi:membrane-bound lytic murein transglycosylase MltF